MLCYAMLCYAMLCYAILCCAVLCCAVLCCAMFCCAMVCYAMVLHLIFFSSFKILDATLTQEVEKFVSNKSLLNPDIDTSVTIFGRHSGEKAEFLEIKRK